jgi:alpha-beta hydrolase superfamily lysophospholipase
MNVVSPPGAPVAAVDAMSLSASAARATPPDVRRLRMADGMEIAVHEVASLRPPRSHAVVLHGTGMHCKVYLPFAKLLSAQGVHVSLVDQRGHGASGGDQGQVDHVMQYADDLRDCLDQLARLQPDLPLFVLAHSGGSAIALKALPTLRTPLSGLAMLAPTLAHDPLMARRRAGGRWRDWRHGVSARPAREVPDNGRSAMSFHLGTFALARLLRIAPRKAALVCQPQSEGEPSFSYSSDAVAASMVASTEATLAQVSCPVLLATGELDVFVNDAAVHLALPWMLAPHVPYCAYSYPGADHFTTLFHATRDIVGWMRATTEPGSAA